jgi:hypothetical protein
MTKQKIWGPAGWPWEMELLALVFVTMALVVPWYLETQSAPTVEELTLVQRAAMEKRQEVVTATFSDQIGFFWALTIVGLYVIHLLFAYSSIDMISTSFPHLFSPLIFSIITYFRLLGLNDHGGDAGIVSGSPLEAVGWIGGVLLITVMVAMLRKARHLRRFKKVEWDFKTGSKFDRTFFTDLALTFRPLLYTPHTYRACPDGILVVGWLYILPIPFSAIQGLDTVRRTNYTSDARFYATSSQTLVRIQPMESKNAIYISPSDRDQFVAYCNQRLSRGVVSLARDDSDDR